MLCSSLLSPLSRPRKIFNSIYYCCFYEFSTSVKRLFYAREFRGSERSAAEPIAFMSTPLSRPASPEFTKQQHPVRRETFNVNVLPKLSILSLSTVVRTRRCLTPLRFLSNSPLLSNAALTHLSTKIREKNGCRRLRAYISPCLVCVED